MKQVKYMRRRLLSVLLCVALVLSCVALFVGCETNVETPEFDTRLNFVTNSGLSIYRIVYPKDNCPGTVLAVAQELQTVMTEVLGVDVALTDDHGSANADDSLQPYEILIGSTARSESQNALSGLGADEYVVRVMGHKIVIAGSSNRATLAGVRHFITEVLGYTDGAPTVTGAEVKIDAHYAVSGWYEVSHVVNAVQDTTLPNAPFSAQTLYVIHMPKNESDRLTATTLQGLIAMQGSEQIYLKTDDSLEQLSALAKSGVALYERTDGEQLWSTGRLLNYFASRLNGYILCSSEEGSESQGVAISLAHYLGAVVVTEKNESIAQAAGLSCVLDVSDKNDAWLRTSSYFPLMRKTLAAEPGVDSEPALIDYVVMTGCYYYNYTGVDDYMHLQQFKYLDEGAYLLTAKAPNAKMLSFDAIGVRLFEMPNQYLYNLSVVSGRMPRELDEALFGKK